MQTLTLYSDPAHAWLKVPVTELSRVGLSWEHDFSSYSYGRTDSNGMFWAYLEEDCDLGIYLARAIGLDGHRPAIKDRHTNGRSAVRSYRSLPYGERFKANLAWSQAFFKERYAHLD